jgi:hypothetical protein
LLSISILSLALKLLLQVLFDPVRFHPSGSWDGWMTMSDDIADGLL